MLNSDKLYELMEAKGVKSLRILSHESGVAHTTLYYMINGHDMNVGTLAMLARYFKEPLDSLVNRSYQYVLLTERRGKTYSNKIKASSMYEVVAKYMM